MDVDAQFPLGDRRSGGLLIQGKDIPRAIRGLWA